MVEVLGFGKHHDRTIEEVFKIDPNYCRFLVNDYTGALSASTESFLKEKFVRGAGSPIIRFGKYKGCSIDYIKTADRPYLSWMSRNEFVLTCPKLLAAVLAALA